MLVPSLGVDKIIALIGLLYVAITFRKSLKLTRFNFILQLTQLHRDLWSKIAEIEGLSDKITSLTSNPEKITEKEKRHIIHVILHMKLSYEANRLKINKASLGVRKDIGYFMNCPLPNTVWESIKDLHETGFVNFIDSAKNLADPLNNPKPNTLINRIKKFVSFQFKSLKRGFRLFFIKRKRKKRQFVEEEIKNDEE